MSAVAERFIRYAKIPTQSAELAPVVPSTECQHDLAKLLGEELTAMGVSDVVVDEHAYVHALLPANCENAPTIAFCAHIDTALEVTDVGNEPRIVKNYDGGDIVLCAEENIVLSPSVFPELKNHVGDDLIVTNGKTLLGADDKAGVAEAVTALDYLLAHPEVKHGAVRVCFCPDEEVGHGARLWDLKRFPADFCYTVDDGSVAGGYAWETFNAAAAKITIRGRAVHPGKSKNTMVNACLVAADLIHSFPPAETPSHTEKYEGFYHLNSITAGVEDAELNYIIRDHDSARFEARKEMVRTLVRQLNERWGAELATVTIREQYRNMADLIRKEMHIVDAIAKADEMAGLKPYCHPVRGGTDGSQLSYRGLLTPNIFTGGHNAHGKYEYASIRDMEKAVEVILNIIKIYADKA